jgi:hypothetical protein
MLLSKAARAAAEALQNAGAELIFPALDTHGPGDDEQPVPNKLLAILPMGSPPDVAREVEKAAHAVLADYVDRVRRKLDKTELVNWRLASTRFVVPSTWRRRRTSAAT